MFVAATLVLRTRLEGAGICLSLLLYLGDVVLVARKLFIFDLLPTEAPSRSGMVHSHATVK